MDYTPETLRQLAHAPMGTMHTAERISIDAHADAWMEDLKNLVDVSGGLLEHAQENVRLCARIEELERARDELGEKLAGLLGGRYVLANKKIADDLVSKQVRIEELERAVRQADVCFSFVGEDARAYCRNQYEAWLEMFATLAKEEK